MLKILKKSVLSVLLLYVLKMSQWDAMYEKGLPSEMQHWSKSFDSRWSMEMWKCTKLQQNRLAASANCQIPGPTNSTPSQLLPIAFWNKLKIYQRIADGIHPKFVELQYWLINSDTDVLAVQELKLWKADKTLFIATVTMLPPKKIEITSLEVAFYFSSRLTSSLKSYTLSKKEAWRFYIFF